MKGRWHSRRRLKRRVVKNETYRSGEIDVVVVELNEESVDLGK